METKRQKQVAELIRRNFSVVLQNEGSYIYGSEILMTVTSVKMSPDMGIAKIYLSVYNTENKQAPILEMEQSYARLRQSLGYRLKRQIRRIPELQFYLDDTLDEMYRLNALFDRLEEDQQMGDRSDGKEATE
ncbi:MAG: 30S ribosome-binding factor RbfA [Bacteroidota bacterium]